MGAGLMQTRLDGDVNAPGIARTFVSKRLERVVGTDWDALGDDIVLIVSELVTNSVRAGATSIDVQVFADGDKVEVQVTDDAAGWPTARNAADDALGGRGLAIIDKLVDSWTTRAHEQGKTVTATWLLHRD
jgi:anti-sigma regulatory factor (Ser/Thr protein kinase)